MPWKSKFCRGKVSFAVADVGHRTKVTSPHVISQTGGQPNLNKGLIPPRVTIEDRNKAKYFEVLAPWLTFAPFMGAQIVLQEKKI